MSYFTSLRPDSSLGDVYYFHMLRLGAQTPSASCSSQTLPGLAMQRATSIGHRWNSSRVPPPLGEACFLSCGVCGFVKKTVLPRSPLILLLPDQALGNILVRESQAMILNRGP